MVTAAPLHRLDLGYLPFSRNIHGTPPKKLRTKDWTAGCIAMTNDEVAEIYAMVRDGTPITISG